MDYQGIQNQYQWVEYRGQDTRDVTYIFVLNQRVPRLKGQSDILYIGETQQPIARRYAQETDCTNTPGNTQQTNIRLTHVFRQLNLANVTCYFTTEMHLQIQYNDPFLRQLEIWDKKYFLGVTQNNPVVISLEKYLIVRYAVDHLEVPPLNNRM
jgi:hypothetical protein